ncbi:methylamine utilization protein MauJ [Candidatus Neomarinimicrobiota bacterium]
MESLILLSIAYEFSCDFDFEKFPFSYEERDFVFHAGSGQMHTCIETYLNRQDDIDYFISLVNKFCLSLIHIPWVSFQFISASTMGLRTDYDSLFTKRPFNQSSPRNLPTENVPRLILDFQNEDQIKAYSLYNDARFTDNLLFRIICLWKILEIPNRSGESASSRLNQILPEINVQQYPVLELASTRVTDLGDYIKSEYRHAIAHIARPPHITSIDYEHRSALLQVSRALDEVAIFYIQRNLGTPPFQEIETL